MIRQSTSVVLLPDWQFVCLSVCKYSAFMQDLAFSYSYLVRCLDDVDYSKKKHISSVMSVRTSVRYESQLRVIIAPQSTFLISYKGINK